ncbi:hypothetical protein D9M68_763810 [compost metagenome]
MGGVKVDEGIVCLLGRGRLYPLGFGALEGIVDLATGQVQAADCAITGELRPASGLIDILTHTGRLLCQPAIVLDQAQRHGHRMGGAHDDLIDHRDRDGGAGHRIHGHRVGVAGATDDHPPIDPDTLVLGAEFVKFRFGDTDQQDRLMVLQHIGILDDTRGIEDHLHIDRLARIGRNVDNIQALEDIAEHLVAGGQGAHLELAVRLGNGVGLGKQLLDALLPDVAVVLCVHPHACGEHQREQNHQPNAPWT